jgi:hypothetical protein
MTDRIARLWIAVDRFINHPTTGLLLTIYIIVHFVASQVFKVYDRDLTLASYWFNAIGIVMLSVLGCAAARHAMDAARAHDHAEGAHQRLDALQAGVDVNNLLAAVHDIYYAACWTPDRDGLWKRLRDAAGFPPGYSPGTTIKSAAPIGSAPTARNLDSL